MIQFKCEKCSESLEYADSASGQTVRCPACRNMVVVPVPADNLLNDRRAVRIGGTATFAWTLFTFVAWMILPAIQANSTAQGLVIAFVYLGILGNLILSINVTLSSLRVLFEQHYWGAAASLLAAIQSYLVNGGIALAMATLARQTVMSK